MKKPNYPAPGNGAIASVSDYERLDRTVPEPGR
jgi:hypothetical protein